MYACTNQITLHSSLEEKITLLKRAWIKPKHLTPDISLVSSQLSTWKFKRNRRDTEHVKEHKIQSWQCLLKAYTRSLDRITFPFPHIHTQCHIHAYMCLLLMCTHPAVTWLALMVNYTCRACLYTIVCTILSVRKCYSEFIMCGAEPSRTLHMHLTLIALISFSQCSHTWSGQN